MYERSTQKDMTNVQEREGGWEIFCYNKFPYQGTS